MEDKCDRPSSASPLRSCPSPRPHTLGVSPVTARRDFADVVKGLEGGARLDPLGGASHCPMCAGDREAEGDLTEQRPCGDGGRDQSVAATAKDVTDGWWLSEAGRGRDGPPRASAGSVVC